MARKKKYDESEVIEKAMVLFWNNGYEGTSTRMLERKMGINQFSIYASFGNKEGLFISCLNLYKQKVKVITNKLEASDKPVVAIKQYFYDFLKFSMENKNAKGCLITNTINELGFDRNQNITGNAIGFTEHIRGLFYNNLKLDITKETQILNQQADYLIVAKASLSMSSKIFKEELLHTYIEQTFINI